MYQDNLRVTARRDLSAMNVELYVYEKHDSGGSIHMHGLAPDTDKPESYAVWSAPTFVVSYGAAQYLLDCLWAEGFRPTDYAGEGVVKAQQEHIDSLRAILKAAGSMA